MSSNKERYIARVTVGLLEALASFAVSVSWLGWEEDGLLCDVRATKDGKTMGVSLIAGDLPLADHAAVDAMACEAVAAIESGLRKSLEKESKAE